MKTVKKDSLFKSKHEGEHELFRLRYDRICISVSGGDTTWYDKAIDEILIDLKTNWGFLDKDFVTNSR